MLYRTLIKRYLFLLLGIMIIGLGIAIFIKANLGIDPFTLMNRGISFATGINFSIIQIGIGLALLSIIFFIDKSKIFIGTLVNMVCVAPIIELFSLLLDSLLPPIGNFYINFLIACIGCSILCVGAGMYLASNLGIAPYDIVALLITEKTSLSFKWMRIATDTLCVLIGWQLGEVIGIGTVIAMFCMGPLIDFSKHKSEAYLYANPLHPQPDNTLSNN